MAYYAARPYGVVVKGVNLICTPLASGDMLLTGHVAAVSFLDERGVSGANGGGGGGGGKSVQEGIHFPIVLIALHHFLQPVSFLPPHPAPRLRPL